MRVLLVRLSALGDVVQSLGAVRALARARPDLELHFVVQREAAPLLDSFAGLASVIEHHRGAGLRGVLATARRMRVLRPHAALDLQGNWKSAVLVRLSGAPRRIGAARPWRREPGSSLLINEKLPGSSHHPADLALDVVRALAPDAVPQLPALSASAAEVAAEARALAALGLDPAAPLRALVLTAAGDPRSWPVTAIARDAAQRGGAQLCLAGPGEADLPAPEGMPCVRHGAGELRRLVALGVHLARVGGEVIGPDRGATHVLAACGASTTVMFGPQDPARTAPPGARVLVHSAAPDCAPCRKRRCQHPDGPVCMAFTTREGRAPAIIP